MPINPIRVAPPDYPANPNVAPLNFDLGLADLGRNIAANRDRQEVGRLLQGAVDPTTGQLDLNKAATALAVSGRDPDIYLAGAIRQQTLRATEAHQRAMENFAQQNAESARIAAERPQYSVQPPTEGDIMTPARPGVVIELPRRPGEAPKSYPYPVVPAPVPATPPAVTPAPSTGRQSAVEPDIESAPPYRVAGPPIPPQSQAAAEPTPAVPQFNESYLATLPTDAARTLVKGVANYEIDPQSLDAKLRAQILTAAKTYRPDYNASEFQKRGSPPSGEIAARVGLSKAFFDKLGDRTTEDGRVIPGVKSRIAAGELTATVGGRAAALFGQGNPGELRSAIDEGAEALLRGLTGAGMSQNEANNYVRRYQFNPLIDSTDTMLKKVEQLENALRYVVTEVGKGRGGDDVLKGFQSKFGEGVAVKPVQNDAEANTLIGQAREALKRDPGARDEIARRLRQRGVNRPELYLGQ